MPLKNVPKKKYESFEDAWGGMTGEAAPKELPVDRLLPFPDHRFQLYEGERKQQMVDSVKEFGILLPLIVWKNQAGDHIVLSGHNRLEAARLAGLAQVPVVVRENLSQEDAVLIVTETNLRQRSFSDLQHSERAYCLAQHYEASKQQGKRNDLLQAIDAFLQRDGTSVHSEQKWEGQEEVTLVHSEQKWEGESTRDKLARESGISQTTFARYVKISTLDPSLMELLDGGEISFLVAYQLAFITEVELQNKLAHSVISGLKISHSVSKLLRADFEDTGLAHLEEILDGGSVVEDSAKKKLAKTMPQIRKLMEKRIPEESYDEIEEILDEALDLYRKANPGALTC